MRVLFVNNDANSAADTCSQLDKHCLLDVAHNGEEGVYLSQVNDYAAIVVESDPGDVCNADLCRYTREEDQKTPIIVLLEEGEVENKLEYLDCGADAVLTKPVDSVLVMAYLRNLIKRAAGAGGSNVLKVGDLCLDMENKRVSRERQDIQLSRKEYELLEFLMLHKNQVVSQERLLEHVWEEGFEVFSNKLAVHIKGLRDKVDRGFDQKLIKTVYGFGYKICA